MATKYCRADGVATWANANGPETNASACCTLGTATSNAAAGDTIIVSGLGGVYRETMYSNSGSSGSLITYTGSNSPIVSGADLITGWTTYSGSVYQAAVTTEPEQVWVDGTFGDRKTSTGNCVNEFDWYWASNVLYLYAPGDPDTQYTSPGVEVGQRNNALALSQTYLRFDGITFNGGNQYTCVLYGASDVTFDNCTIQWGWLHGLIANSASLYSNIIIEDSTLRYCGSHGVVFTDSSGHTGCVVRRCDVYENGTYQGYWESDQQWTGGIKVLGNPVHDCVIEQNDVHDNGPATPENGVQKGWGVWLDYCFSESGYETAVRHNRIYDNQNGAIFLEVSAYNNVYGNVGWNNAPGGDAGIYTNSNLRLDARSTEGTVYNKFYNNTFTGGRIGFLAVSFAQDTGCEISNNELKNNILVNNTSYALYCDAGADNDGTYGSGNVYEGNCFGAERSSFILWNGTNYSTYDAWLAASSQTDNNVEADPVFTDVDNHDLTLAGGSPCISAGINLGADFDDGLLPTSSWPDGVVTGDRDEY